MSDKIVHISKYDFLTSTELETYTAWLETEENQLSPIAGARFYELFLNGSSCQEISTLNPGVTLGQVLQARIKMDWDRHRNEYVDDLMKKAEQRHKQVALETIEMVSSLLTVNNKRFNKKIQSFMKSGNEQDLDDLAMNMKQYKEMTDLHHKLLAVQTEKKQVVTGEIIHTHRQEEVKAEPKDPASLIDQLLEGEIE